MDLIKNAKLDRVNLDEEEDIVNKSLNTFLKNLGYIFKVTINNLSIVFAYRSN
jgi:hypothetical protein